MFLERWEHCALLCLPGVHLLIVVTKGGDKRSASLPCGITPRYQVVPGPSLLTCSLQGCKHTQVGALSPGSLGYCVEGHRLSSSVIRSEKVGFFVVVVVLGFFFLIRMIDKPLVL